MEHIRSVWASAALVDGALQRDVRIRFSGGSIAAVEPGVAPRADLVFEGGLLLPGFIDAHVHMALSDASAVLAGGVTTARDTGWRTDIFDAAAASREDLGGPLLLACGPMLTCPGGYPSRARWAPAGVAREVEDETQARAAVRDLVAAGACAIKIALNAEVGPTLSAGLVTAIVEEAHGAGVTTTTHAYGLHELEKAVACGVDELAHMLMSPEDIPGALLEDMVAAGMAVVPTLAIRGSDAGAAIANLRRFREAGGTVVYGTDLGNAGPRPGIDPREVALMAAAGMSPVDIVASATTASAAWLGLDDVGRLEAGTTADLIVVEVEALTDATALAHVRMVARNGVPAA